MAAFDAAPVYPSRVKNTKAPRTRLFNTVDLKFITAD